MSVTARYLLDTNIVSELVRRPQGRVAQHISEVGEDNVCTSIVVAAELRYGAEKLGSRRLSRQLGTILSALDVLPMEPPADREYAKLRHRLETRGLPIGPNDLLIAAHALAGKCTLVTANQREFARVPGLKVVDWLAA